MIWCQTKRSKLQTPCSKAIIQDMTYNLLHMFDVAEKRGNLDVLLNMKPHTWKPSLLNEIIMLRQSILDIVGNRALKFVSLSTIPKIKKLQNVVGDYRPLKW